jgi:hypothetical protein
MKLEEIKNKTNEAVSYLVAALESGESEVLTQPQYLNAMARFHHLQLWQHHADCTAKTTGNQCRRHSDMELGGEKGILILAPMVGYRKSRQSEVATEIDTDNAADERRPEPQLVGFRAVYVFDGLSRESRPSLCALDVIRECHFRNSPR